MGVEERLRCLEEDIEISRKMCDTLIERASILFQRAEREENSLKHWSYRRSALFFQRRAVSYGIKFSRNTNEYLALRRQMINHIEESAEVLGYKAKLDAMNI